MDKQKALAEGNREFPKAQKLGWAASLIFYIISDLPLLHWKFALFIIAAIFLASFIQMPIYVIITATRAKFPEDKTNVMMALLMLPLIAFSVFSGYLSVQIYRWLLF